jgi:class 3 adenylate cyclase
MARPQTRLTNVGDIYIASRVLKHAPPGQILVSGTVKDLTVGSGLDMKPAGSRTMKGVPGERALHLVASRAGSRLR